MTPEELAEAYAVTIYGQPNGWGQYCHPTLGQSHDIMNRLSLVVGTDRAQDMIQKAMKNYQNGA